MNTRKAKKAIREDRDLLKLAKEVNTICELDSLNPLWQTLPQKMGEYRKQLAEKGIIDSKKLEILENKEIFIKYVNPVIKQNLFVRIFKKFSC